MNYPAFTNDSLTMMYEGVRGALGTTMRSAVLARSEGFAFVKLTNGGFTPPISRSKCSGGE